MLKRVIKKRSSAGRRRGERFVAMFHAPSRMILRTTASYFRLARHHRHLRRQGGGGTDQASKACQESDRGGKP